MSYRRNKWLRRLLTLIDVMARHRGGMTVAQWAQLLNEELETDYHVRTVYRDLNLLAEYGFVSDAPAGPDQPRMRLWKLELRRSTTIQHAAMMLQDGLPPGTR